MWKINFDADNKMTDRLKIVVGINSLVSTTHAAYGNHINLFYRLGRSYTNIDFILVNPPRMTIDRFRNMAAEIALVNDADYLLFLDDDVLVPIDAPYDFLTKLINADSDICAGDVLIRGYPFNHMLFRYTDESKTQMPQLEDVPEPKGLIAVDAVGFSLCLIKVSLLRKCKKPFFVTGLTSTEDIYFCIKSREQFPETTIKADTSIECAHILWEETISDGNKKNYKRYYELQYLDPGFLESEEVKKSAGGDRGSDYYKLVNQTLNQDKLCKTLKVSS